MKGGDNMLNQTPRGLALEVNLQNANNQQQIVKFIEDAQKEGHQFTRTDWSIILEAASKLPKY